MYEKRVSLAVVIGLLICSVPLFAHHGAAVFDTSKVLTMKGTVVEWFWANPHCLLKFDVKDENGQAVRWVAETQAPINMIGAGWRKDSFKPGDNVTVAVRPVKSGQPVGAIVGVVLANGNILGRVEGANPPASGTTTN